MSSHLAVGGRHPAYARVAMATVTPLTASVGAVPQGSHVHSPPGTVRSNMFHAEPVPQPSAYQAASQLSASASQMPQVVYQAPTTTTLQAAPATTTLQAPAPASLQAVQVVQAAPTQPLQAPTGGWTQAMPSAAAVAAAPQAPQVVSRVVAPSQVGQPAFSFGEKAAETLGVSIATSPPATAAQSSAAPAEAAALLECGTPQTPGTAVMVQNASASAAELPDAPLTQRDLQAWLEAERSLWFSSMQELHTQQMQALEAITDKVDQKIGTAMERISDVSSRFETQVSEIEARFKMSLGDLETRMESDRTERQAALVEVRRDLDGQWAQVHNLSVSRGSNSAVADAGAQAEAEAKAMQERRELLVAFAAICSDVEALQGAASSLQAQQGKLSADTEVLLKWQEGMMEESRTQNGNFIKVRAAQSQLSSDVEALQSQLKSGAQAGSSGPLREELDLLRATVNAEVEALRKQQGTADAVQAEVMSDLGAVKTQLIESVKALWGENRKWGLEIETLKQAGGAGPSVAQAAPSAPSSPAAPPAAAPARGDLEALRDEVDAVRSSHSILKAVQGQHTREIEALRKSSVAPTAPPAPPAPRQNSELTDDVSSQLRSLEMVINDTSNDVQAVQDQQRRHERLLDDLSNEVGRLGGSVEGVRNDVSQSYKSIEALQNQHVNEMELLQSQNATVSRELEAIKKAQEGGFNWPWQCSHNQQQQQRQ